MIIRVRSISYEPISGAIELDVSMTQAQMHDALLAIMAELDPQTKVSWMMEINETKGATE
jgi:hypothetical protein